MKKTYKHTSGPWEVVPNKDRSSLFIYRKGAPDGAVPLARTLADERENVDQEANASLIAAAPTMLHALKLAEGYFRDAARTSPQHFAGYLKVISGAIAETEGLVECEECGQKKTPDQLCDPTASEPHCKECAEGFWEMMGDDPHGRDWG